MKQKEKNNRLECNRQLIRILSNYLEEFPDMRFSQALMNCYFVKQENRDKSKSIYGPMPDIVWQDEFYLESEELLKRIIEVMKDKR